MDCKSFERSKLKWLKAEIKSAKKKWEDAKKRSADNEILDYYYQDYIRAMSSYEGYSMGVGL